MKNLIVLIISLTMISFTYGQTEGKICYTQTTKLDLDLEGFAGISDSMKDLIPSTTELKKELLFNQSESLYQNQKGESVEDTNIESEDGSFQFKIMRDDTEEILYQNLADKKVIHQKGLFGKSFIVESALEKSRWKITNEKIKYLDYECQKATIENDDQFIVAWFTPQIPVQLGPNGFHGLPGAILLISIDDGKTEIKATKVDMSPVADNSIEVPSDGKKVTEEKYEKIQKEKEEEMKSRYSRPRSSR